MKGSTARAGAMTCLLGVGLALAGCTESGGPEVPRDTEIATSSTAGSVDPTSSGATTSAAPNFEFAVGEAYRNDPSTSPEFLIRIEAFFGEVVLNPLQRLPDLLPRTVTVVYDRCGTANAFHDGPSATITLCHELAEYAYELLAAEEPNLGLEELTRRVFFMMGFALYHEIGHALDYQLDLPLAGNVESNVDAIATVISVETGGFNFLYALGGAVLFGQAPQSLTGQHGGGLDRRGDIECWTVGGSELAATTLTDQEIGQLYDFDDVGRDCESEYLGQRDTVRSWVPGLSRLNAGSPEPDAGSASSFRLTLVPEWLAGDGGDPDTLRRVTRLFEGAFARLDNAVEGLSSPVEVVYDACGEPLSSYDPSSRTVTLCSELVDHAYPLVLEQYGTRPTAFESAFALESAYSLLEFHLYHEIGHALIGRGRSPGDEDLELDADALATVLLVESDNGLLGAYAHLYAITRQSPEQAARHGDADPRAVQMACLTVGGDPAVRWDPYLSSEVVLDVFVTGDRDCIAEYAARRDQVRAWLADSDASERSLR